MASCSASEVLEKKSYLESESSRHNNGSPAPHPRSSSITRGPPLIRHTIGDSIRKYQVRIQGGRAMREGSTGSGRRYWRIRTRAIHYKSTGRILSYQSLLVSSSSSPTPLARRPSLRPLYSVRYLPIYLSIGWMSECTNQALMHAKRCSEKLIVIHVRRLSHAFSTRRCVSRQASGWKNKFQSELPGQYQLRLLLVSASKESS